MKKFVLTAFIGAVASFGCAPVRPTEVGGVVGPAPAMAAAAASNPSGTLMVYSAFETNSLGASPFNDVRMHTAYEIYSDKGALLYKIENHAGGLGEAPSPVKLSPGIYRVVARSNGHGPVSVSVRIENNLVTAVHLDSDGPAIATSAEPVRLPTGEVVGWNGAR